MNKQRFRPHLYLLDFRNVRKEEGDNMFPTMKTICTRIDCFQNFTSLLHIWCTMKEEYIGLTVLLLPQIIELQMVHPFYHLLLSGQNNHESTRPWVWKTHKFPKHLWKAFFNCCPITNKPKTECVCLCKQVSHVLITAHFIIKIKQSTCHMVSVWWYVISAYCLSKT